MTRAPTFGPLRYHRPQRLLLRITLRLNGRQTGGWAERVGHGAADALISIRSISNSGRVPRHPAGPSPTATTEAAEAAAFLDIGKPQFETQLDCVRSESLLYARLERWCADPRLARRHAAEIRTNAKARFYLGLTCTGITLDAGERRALRLRAKNRSGSNHSITARHYVLAAGGIETARLLLASTEAAPSEMVGLSPWLGRGYMGHFDGTLADIVLDRLSEDEIDYTLDENLCYVRRRLMLRRDIIRQSGVLNIAFFFGNPPLGDWRHRSGALSAAALALYTPIVGRRLQPGPIRNYFSVSR